jgi:hypothetical protein
MRIAFGVLVAVALTAVVTGCSTEDPNQADARLAVQKTVAAAHGYSGQVHCTGNPKPWFVEQQASLFVCVARRDDHGCDWFRASLENAGWAVTLDRRNGGCVVPT